MGGLRERTAVTALLAGACWAVAGTAPSQSPPDITVLVSAIGDRVADYYRGAQSVICLERSMVQPIQANWSQDGLGRTVESDLRVELTGADGAALPEPRVTREIRRINGRAPHERDKRSRAGCTDPSPLSPEPLAFLMPAHRGEYRFTAVRSGSDQRREAFVIDFESTTRTSRPELVQDEFGHDECFDWRGPIATRGRVWVDAQTDDVLRVEQHLRGPVDVRVPANLQRRYGFGNWVVLERDDLAMRYKRVRFSDPDEVLLLPESIESMTIVRSGLQSTRRIQTFSDYRRFITGGRIIKGP